MGTTLDSSPNDRQAQLIAAARALRTWVNEQRDTWPERPVSAAPPAPVLAPRPIEPVRAAVDQAPVAREEKREETRESKREAKREEKRKDKQQRKEQEAEKAKEKIEKIKE